MNIFNAIASATAVFEQGKALSLSTILTNTEAGAAMLYGFLAALVTALNAFGIELTVGGTDLHTVANGWSATISIVYAAYRAATNPNTGLKAQ